MKSKLYDDTGRQLAELSTKLGDREFFNYTTRFHHFCHDHCNESVGISNPL